MEGTRRVTGPGRVNLIGDHTDYNLGLVLPLAVDVGVTATFVPGDGPLLQISSDAFPGRPAVIPVDLGADQVPTVEPAWARPVAAVVSLVRPARGGRLHLASTVPVGAGLSSSAAVCVATAVALGVDGPARTVAELCRQAEHRAGVPVGIMDPLVCAGGVAGHALRIDCATLDCRPVVLPAGLDVLVVDSGLPRTLAGSAYALRVAECEAAAEIVGPLGRAGPDDLPALRDPLLRRRARHVIGECARVDGMVDALVRDDLATVGTLLDDSHRSLSDWFEVSTPAVDDLVARLRAHPGILGVRMTGAGFGGCLVAGAEAGAVDPDSLPGRAWRVRAVDGTVTAADRLR